MIQGIDNAHFTGQLNAIDIPEEPGSTSILNDCLSASRAIDRILKQRMPSSVLDSSPRWGCAFLSGRPISDADDAGSYPVAVVNQAFVNKYLHGRQPLKHYPNLLVFRYHGDVAKVSEQLRHPPASIDPNIAVLHVLSYDDEIGRLFIQQELVVRLTSLFGLPGLILVFTGLYGVTAYSVARRTYEIGIRMALGASRSSVLRMVMCGALAQTMIGLAVGVPFAFFAETVVKSTLSALFNR